METESELLFLANKLVSNDQSLTLKLILNPSLVLTCKIPAIIIFRLIFFFINLWNILCVQMFDGFNAHNFHGKLTLIISITAYGSIYCFTSKLFNYH